MKKKEKKCTFFLNGIFIHYKKKKNGSYEKKKKTFNSQFVKCMRDLGVLRHGTFKQTF